MEKVKLGDACVFIRNGANIKNDKGKSGIPITRIETIANGVIDEDSLGYANIYDEKYEDYYLKQNDILMSHINSMKHLGKVAICNEDKKIIHGMNLLNIRLKENILAKYVYYFFKTDSFRKQLHKISKQSVNQRSFNVNDLKKISIDLPDFRTQNRVADIMDKVEEIIDIRKKQIEQLDELVKSQFVEMFGDIKTNNKNWKEYDTIGNICILNPRKSEIDGLGNIEVSFVPMQSVSDKGDIETKEIKLLNDVKKGFTYFRENDVLFAKITPCMENGKGAVAHGLKNTIGFGSTEFHVIRPTEKVNSVWMYTYTTFNSFRKEAEKKMTGSAGQKRVPISFFEKYKIAVPPIELQNKFGEFVKQVDKQKFEIQKSLEETQKLQESLMNKYFG